MIDEIRFRRHISIDEIGKKGQECLNEKSVLVIGAGGLGSPILLYLCAAGIGKIGVMEFDSIDVSNLQRQILHKYADVGCSKLDSALERLRELNPDCNLKGYPFMANKENLQEITKQYDIIIDAVDNILVRYEINEACMNNKKPFIHGSINRFEGSLMLIKPGFTACYNCVHPKSLNIQEEIEIGVVSPVPGIVGAMQALLAIEELLGIAQNHYNQLYYFDGKNFNWKKIKLKKDEKCKICGRFYG